MFTSDLKAIPRDDSYVGVNFLVRVLPINGTHSAINWRDVPPTFYSQNHFTIDEPVPALQWLQNINIEHLTDLRIFIPATWQGECPPAANGPWDREIAKMLDGMIRPPSGPPWCELFDKLAKEAVGLRTMLVYWDSAFDYPHLGGGADVSVVRALGRIRGLQRVEIGGFYAKEWPPYLEGKMGIKMSEDIQARPERTCDLREFQRDLKDMSP